MVTDLPTHTPASADTAETGRARQPPIKDGRQLRRLRNIEAVRAAILDLHLEREPLDLETVAARAGVTVRSIYRYHADLDAAIDDAIESRVRYVHEVWSTQVMPSPDQPLSERIEIMLNHRMQLEALGRPLRNTIQQVSPDPDFDREVLEVFDPELARFSGAELASTTAAVCFLLRPRGLRSVIEFPQHGDVDARSVVVFSLRRLLTAPPSGELVDVGRPDSST